MDYTLISVRINKESCDRLKKWAKMQAVEHGRFSLNAWIVDKINDGMKAEGV